MNGRVDGENELDCFAGGKQRVLRSTERNKCNDGPVGGIDRLHEIQSK